jgi:hypothetical protein
MDGDGLMISRIRSYFKKFHLSRKLYYNYLLPEHKNKERLPWKRVCRSSGLNDVTPGTAEIRKKILIGTCTGDHQSMIDIESLLAVALSLRNARVHALLCDRFLPACLMCEIGTCISVKKIAKEGPSEVFCKRCFDYGLYAYRSAGIETHLFSEYVTLQDITQVDETADRITFEEVKDFKFEGLQVGEHAVAGALRFFAKGSLDEERHALPVLKRYLKASILTAIVIRRMQQKIEFDSAVFHHGIYVPHGVIGEVLRKERVPLVNWNIGYRKGTFIFSHNDTYHHTMMTEPVSKWESITWNSVLEQRVLDYIRNRSKGTRDWHVFLQEPSGHLDTLGLDTSLPAIGLLTNVCWDAQLHYPANIFKNMLEWIFLTLEYFIKRPDLQLVIRVHPAEVTAELPSRQRVVEEIEKTFPDLPPNIFVVSPKSRMNTYDLMDKCNAVIIYGTKTGVELTSFGIPVIVAGEAWIRNKGITMDPEAQEDYFKLLDRLPLENRMSEAQIQRARKYAYHFFFRRMIPIEVVRPVDGYPSFVLDVNELDQILPNKNQGLDIICNGILSGRDLIFEDEKRYSTSPTNS